jgi:hypothetical protein
MNRRQLFLSTAKAALLAVFGWWRATKAEAQPVSPAAIPGGGHIEAVPGSPTAWRTTVGNALPAPAAPFGGVANLNAAQSTEWWPPLTVPPAGAPNILLIMIDDEGFAAPSTSAG